ncbi:MAG TPA: glycosyltransferase [Bryobacteraceae bacterium]|nr:glycosyltransferase [Bryobacteraceae bacterium]
MFVVRGLPILRCRSCGCVVLGTPRSAPDFSGFYPERKLAIDRGETPVDDITERDATARYTEALRRRGVSAGSLLVVCGAHSRVDTEVFLAHARANGFRAEKLDPAEETDPSFRSGSYDAAIMLHQLQTQPEPGGLLRTIHRALRPGAPVLLTVPRVNSWPARFFGRDWTEWRHANRLYFDQTTIQLLLLRFGFRDVLVRRDKRLYTPEHIYRRACDSPATTLTRAISLVHTLLTPAPGFRVRLATSGMIVTAVRGDLPEGPKCSIIVAAYNERNSFPTLMDALLKKDFPGTDREIIVIESNSNDGTRELAAQYRTQPGVKLVFQERPLGKGNAIREGLRHASGDVVLIQDADLEYDLNDYEELLAPILSHQALFVLGTRHGGAWKMRRFAGQKGLAAVVNFGHVFFTGLINILFRQKMTDPFTMFKVFHRDCLFGLEFSCNRFDFDHELVIKFVRKGYVPLEIPVNYSSRSFREGKKVRMFRDPLTWVWVDFKLRFSRLYRKTLA